MRRTKEDIRKENVKFVLKCIGYLLILAIFAPGILSLFVGYAIGYAFYSFVVRYFMD